ncbi:MAG: glycosyltransferase, partial [Tepidimonas ignava]
MPADTMTDARPATNAADAAVDVSIVVPVYHERDNLHELVERVWQAMAPTPWSFELICVDDGST